jgi:hypothetical protein
MSLTLMSLALAMLGIVLVYAFVEPSLGDLRSRHSRPPAPTPDPRPDVPLAVVVIGGLLVLVLVDLTAEAYLGISPLGVLSGRPTGR